MKLALWYHVMLFRGQRPADARFSQAKIDPDWSIPLMLEQMETVKQCGLLDAVDDFVICVNGDSENQSAARACAPAKARFIDNGPDANSLLPTMRHLRNWCLTHQDWAVCFFHAKGVTHAHQTIDIVWRKCMEHWTIKRWRQCVADLESGCDSVGTHWLTPEEYGAQCPIPIWGGMFWWAKTSFLAELPELQTEPKSTDDWWLPERWIGMGRRPKVKDYAKHWPGIQPCESSVK
jgi:hypothetical protein